MLAGALALLAVSLGLAACGGKSGGGDATSASGGGLPETIKIGATSEITGPVPTLGAEAKGYEAAVKWINAHGGIDGHEIELTVQDNAGEPAKAVSDLRTYAQQGVKLVVGGAFGPDCAAEAPIAAESDMIVFCGSTDNLPEPDDHMFGVGLGYSPTIEAAAKELISPYSKKPALFADKDKSGDDTAEEGPKQLEAAGTEPILIRTAPTESSFKASIQKAISEGADGLWFSECTPAAISAVGDAKALGYEEKIYLENCLASFEVAEALKNLVGNEQMVTLQVPSMLLPGKAPNQEEQEAIELFKEAVPGKPNVVIGAGWDSIFIIKKLLEQTKTEDVETNLKALEDNFQFHGVWQGGTYTKEDHRGAVAEGYATPAAITEQGTFEALK
jgi:branched-chain amino acid transport system substrate-binding protein